MVGFVYFTKTYDIALWSRRRFDSSHCIPGSREVPRAASSHLRALRAPWTSLPPAFLRATKLLLSPKAGPQADSVVGRKSWGFPSSWIRAETSFSWCRTKIGVFIHKSLNSLWQASKSKPNPYFREQNAPSQDPAVPLWDVHSDSRWSCKTRSEGGGAWCSSSLPGGKETFGFGMELERLGSMRPLEASPLCHKLRKGNVCFKSRRRWPSLLFFRRGDGWPEVGMWCSAPSPTAGFMCSLAYIIQGDTWNGLSPFSSELRQLPSE